MYRIDLGDVSVAMTRPWIFDHISNSPKILVVVSMAFILV
jgi:hypothetical protein